MRRSDPSAGPVRLLASGMALGHYVPAVLLNDRLRRQGRRSCVHVYEACLPAARRDAVTRTRDRYQANPQAARIGQRLHSVLNAGGPDTPGPAAAIQLPPDSASIVAFSGQWAPVIEDLKIDPARVTLVHMDIEASPSWSQHDAFVARLVRAGAQALWLSRLDPRGRFLLLDDGPVPGTWGERKREPSILVHGGGWALGPICEAGALLAARGWKPHLLLGSRPPLSPAPQGMEQYGAPPGWAAWDAEPGRPYQPLLRIGPDGRGERYSNGAAHDVLDLAGRSQAIVTKPGGMSLAESLMTATPLLFLEPFGAHEAANARAWVGHGFAMAFDAWREAGCQPEALRRMHERLVDARSQARGLPALLRLPAIG